MYFFKLKHFIDAHLLKIHRLALLFKRSADLFYARFSPVHINDMQTHSPSKRAVFIFWSQMMRNVLKGRKNQFSDFCDF